MKINIKATNIELTDALKDWTEKKLASLEKFANIFHDDFVGKGQPAAEIWVEIGKTSFHHKKGDVFRAEAQVHFPGKSIRAVADSEDLRTAITEAKDKLQRQFTEYKEKFITKKREI